MALAAPALLEAGGRHLTGGAVRAFFSFLCHQDAARSFTLLGHPLAVCHRCSGIYLGIFLCLCIPVQWSIVADAPRFRRLWVVAATMPLLLDTLLPIAGLWVNTAASRLATGGWFGGMLASLLVAALADIARAAPRQRACAAHTPKEVWNE